jgi:hypothetical protein
MLSLIIGSIIGILGSVGTAIAIEYLRKPKLSLSIERPTLDLPYPEGHPARRLRNLRILVHNKPLPYLVRWMIRAPALQCRATITFHDVNDGQDIFGRAMDGRWANTPQPVATILVTPRGEQYSIFDLARFSLDSRIDIYPDETEMLDIACRCDDDVECYGWNNETYFSTPRWRNPNWRLPGGQRYLVKVIITSSGQKQFGCFQIMNNVPIADFRLEMATRGQIASLTRGHG